MRRLLLLILIVVAVGLFVAHNHHQPSLKNKKGPSNVCSTDACIKITESDGSVYRLNDFRFAVGHCILFISLPDNKPHHFCGNYKLDWIGPVPPVGQRRA